MSPDPFVELPDPAHAGSVGDLVDRLRRLKVWAGDPSYETITGRVNAAWTAAGRPAGELARRSTVANCFQPGRRRMNADLVLAVVEAIHPDAGYVTQWRQALRAVGGEIEAVSQVRVQGGLPQDLAGFAGRAEELDRLRRLADAGDSVVLSAIEGMAGVGKTRLAVHAGHRLLRAKAFDQVLFVNLRGFDPDPAQPPADPAAVLDGFLRLLGVPAQRIPHGLAALTAAYRERLAHVRALVVLDNAATAAQVRPLLPATAGSLGLVTSRRRLDGLDAVTHLSVGLFAPGEAEAFLTAAVAGTPPGPDPEAVARIARRSGYLPLALSLIAGHIRATPGWTLTDHADRLDERHRDRRLDTAVELALDLSYRHLPADHRRLLRLAALHPGNDLDAYAAAALAGSGVDTARDRLDRLVADHLLQLPAPGRYAFHDLVRAFAAVRAGEEERPPDRRAALTRVFDYYLAAAAGATNTIHSAKHTGPPGVTIPELDEPGAAVAWLEIERPTLVAVAAHTVAHGWPTHTIRLSRILFQHLGGGDYHDAEIVHGHAYRAALALGDPDEQARALTDLGNTLRHLARIEESVDLLHRALVLYGPDDHPVERARILNGLADIEMMAGRHVTAIDYFSRSLDICRTAGDPAGEARALCGLAVVEELRRDFEAAAGHCRLALALFRQVGSITGVANMLNGLGQCEMWLGRYDVAGRYLGEALALSRQYGFRGREAEVLDSLGLLHLTVGELDRSAADFELSRQIFEETGATYRVPLALNGLGEVALKAGRPAEAVERHTGAYAIAVEVDDPGQQARAQTGLGHARRALGDRVRAREHYEQALVLYTKTDMSEADEVREHLAGLG